MMNDRVKVSVIMPNYNGALYLEKAINSVLHQTYKAFEFIIIDDGSTDNSREIIESYDDIRIVSVFLEKNNHVSVAVNEGFKRVTGKYIARIDSDDIWELDKLEKQVDFMEKHPEYGACFTKVNIIDDNSKIANDKYWMLQGLFNNAYNRTRGEWAYYFLNTGNCLCNPSVLIRTDAIDEVGRYYNLAFVPAEDFDMWCRLVVKYPIYIMDDILTNYRWTEKESKISGLEEDGKVAFQNVHMILRMNYLDSMSLEDFKTCFHQYFVNTDSRTDLELECEKAFLLLQCTSNCGKFHFLWQKKIEAILREPDGLEILEDKFDFNLKDFYKSLRVRNFYDFDVKNRINALQTDKSILEKEIVVLREQRISLQNDLHVKSMCIDELNIHINELNAVIHAKEDYIFEAQNRIEDLDKQVLMLEAEVLEQEHLVRSRDFIILDKEDKIAVLNASLNELKLIHQNEMINLEKQIESIYQSISWKVTSPIRKFADFFINKMSRLGRH